MAGGSEDGFVGGSPLDGAGSGGGRAPASWISASGGEPGCCVGADGNGGGPVLAGGATSRSGASGAGSGDPGRRGVGGNVFKRTPSFAVSGGRALGSGGGPAGARVVSSCAPARSEPADASASGGPAA